MKIKTWEIGLLFVLMIAVYLFLINLEKIPEIKVSIPEGASDDYILESAYKNTDEGACYLLDDKQDKEDCLAMVEDKTVLDESVQQVKEEYSGVSINDQKLLAKATIEKDSSLCEQIIDAVTRTKCYNNLS